MAYLYLKNIHTFMLQVVKLLPTLLFVGLIWILQRRKFSLWPVEGVTEQLRWNLYAGVVMSWPHFVDFTHKVWNLSRNTMPQGYSLCPRNRQNSEVIVFLLGCIDMVLIFLQDFHARNKHSVHETLDANGKRDLGCLVRQCSFESGPYNVCH